MTHVDTECIFGAIDNVRDPIVGRYQESSLIDQYTAQPSAQPPVFTTRAYMQNCKNIFHTKYIDINRPQCPRGESSTFPL